MIGAGLGGVGGRGERAEQLARTSVCEIIRDVVHTRDVGWVLLLFPLWAAMGADVERDRTWARVLGG